MRQPSKNYRKFLRRGVMAAVFAGLSVSVSADQVTIHKALDVLSDKNPFADPVESVASESTLEKLGTEGSWVKVRTPGGKEGYVTSEDIAPPGDLSGLAANSQAGNAVASSAGRGLNNDSLQFAQQKNLRLDGYRAMIETGKSVTRADVRNFGKEGHVGPAKYRSKAS